MMRWLWLGLLVAGCVARPLAYYEHPINWSHEAPTVAMFSINFSDGSHMPYPSECTSRNPEENHGRWWHGYYFPNHVMRRRFANQHGLSVCQYDELVLGCHPGRISGYPWPITDCNELLSEPGEGHEEAEM